MARPAAAATFTFGSQKFLAQLLSAVVPVLAAAVCDVVRRQAERIIYGLPNLCLNFNRNATAKAAKPER